MLSTIFQVIIALPKIISMLKEMFLAIEKMQDAKRLEAAKKANNDGNNIELEKQLGSVGAGNPSGIDGAILRPKKHD